MIRRLLIVDTETSGLDAKKDHLLEVGAVIWSVEHCSTIASRSWLVSAPDNAAERVNGIPPALLVDGMCRDDVNAELLDWARLCDAAAAHNCEFDRQWLPDLGLPWIDTCYDIEWPRSAAGSLTSVMLSHGLAVLDAHRALPDCQMIARLLERVAEIGHDVQAMLERAMRPKVEVVSLAPFDQKDVVKAAGFRWSPERKVWWRMCPAEDVAALPFRTRLVTPPAVTQPMRPAAAKESR